MTQNGLKINNEITLKALFLKMLNLKMYEIQINLTNFQRNMIK